MPASAGLALLALLRRIQSFGHTLKSLILRCLIFWPHILRNLRRIRPLCSWTDSKDTIKKKGGPTRARPSFPRAEVDHGVCEGYSTIYASRNLGRSPNRSSEPHLPLEPGNTRVLHLLRVDSGVRQSQTAPPSPVSTVSSMEPSPGSPHFSDRHFPGSSTSPIANVDEIQLPHGIPHLNAPLTLTHERATSARFAGARRPRSRSHSPLPRSRRDGFPQSPTLESDAPTGRSRPPSPYRPLSPLPFPQPHPLPESIPLESSGNIQIPDVVISGPPETPETAEADSSPPFPVPFSEGNLSQLPTAGEEHLMPGPSYPGNLGPGQENARRSNDTLALPPQAPRFPSDTSLQHIPTIINESGDWSDGKKRSIGLMHSEQVSRYVNNGDV